MFNNLDLSKQNLLNWTRHLKYFVDYGSFALSNEFDELCFWGDVLDVGCETKTSDQGTRSEKQNSEQFYWLKLLNFWFCSTYWLWLKLAAWCGPRKVRPWVKLRLWFYSSAGHGLGLGWSQHWRFWDVPWCSMPTRSLWLGVVSKGEQAQAIS